MNKNINVPNLRFKEFSGEWEEKTLNDLGTFLGGGTPSKSNESYWGGNIPWISSSDILEDNIHKINISRFINPISIKESATKLIPKNSILFVSRVGVGKLAINQDELCTSQDFTNFISKDTNSYYLGYLFQSKKSILESFNQGTSIKGFTKNDISTLKIKIPQKEEQEKIAIFLSSIDEKIEKLTKKDELLQQYKKSIMQKIFSQEIRFKDDKENEFPKWEEKKLKNICDVIKGEQLNKDNLTEIGDYPAINGGINPSGFTDKWNTLKNTITISEGGNSCGYVNFIKTNFWSGGHNYSLQNLKENIENRYLFQYLKYNESQIMNLRVGSGLPNIQKSDIVNFEILLPCIEEQDKIANFLSSIDDKIEENQKLLEKAKEFKKALLQQMFV
ncbi:type I restriction/modification system, specificity subunit [Aliarcobacter faecis]|uniref:restriction endonuclease subunit S n=1 Tax=Aliarcobacter faecis TaxID=1564138 RepID=UPI000478F06D|nr:restriction endonuclease subunit S [Aliarcobacter faecis]QKF72999.1 type I restriction/modification system, specificity subunit [Aliarcobacter faecis]